MKAPAPQSTAWTGPLHASHDDCVPMARSPRRVAHPLGPILERRTARHRGRMVGLVVAIGAIVVLALAGTIVPDPSGLGSHQQLGLAPCFMPAIVGIPCPTCGMTTAFAHAVRFQFVSAAAAQPVGLLLAGLTFTAMTAGFDLLVTGRYWTLNWYRVSAVGLVVTFAGLVLISWIGKIAVGVVDGTYPISR